MTVHGAQSIHNKNTYDFLITKTPKYLDWQITTLFYAALHAVNRHFELQGIKAPERHGKRLALVKRRLPSISSAYQNLQMLSEQSRYGGRDEVDDDSMKSALKFYSRIMSELA